MKKTELWATPIYEFDLGVTPENNKAIFSFLDKNIESDYVVGVDVQKMNNPLIKDLYEEIHTCLHSVVYDTYPQKYVYKLTRSWMSRQKPGKNLDVHAHGGIAFAAVYYVNVPDNSGDLLLLDPRGGVNWFSETAGTNSSQIYHRIKPKAGHLVVFPGFLLHEVETNKSQDVRMCIANNIIVVPREFA